MIKKLPFNFPIAENMNYSASQNLQIKNRLHQITHDILKNIELRVEEGEFTTKHDIPYIKDIKDTIVDFLESKHYNITTEEHCDKDGDIYYKLTIDWSTL